MSARKVAAVFVDLKGFTKRETFPYPPRPVFSFAILAPMAMAFNVDYPPENPMCSKVDFYLEKFDGITATYKQR